MEVLEQAGCPAEGASFHSRARCEADARGDVLQNLVWKDVTLHSPNSEANKVFNLKTMQNICQNVGVLENSHAIVNSQSINVENCFVIVACGRQCD